MKKNQHKNIAREHIASMNPPRQISLPKRPSKHQRDKRHFNQRSNHSHFLTWNTVIKKNYRRNLTCRRLLHKISNAKATLAQTYKVNDVHKINITKSDTVDKLSIIDKIDHSLQGLSVTKHPANSINH